MAGTCASCGGVVKEWDLVCPHCGATLFTPQAPQDSKKVSVDLPQWEMSPSRPEEPRKTPPPRPEKIQTPPGGPASKRIEVPGVPGVQPGGLTLDGAIRQEPTEVISVDEISMDEPAPIPAEKTDVLSVQDVEVVAQGRARMPTPTVPAPGIASYAGDAAPQGPPVVVRASQPAPVEVRPSAPTAPSAVAAPAVQGAPTAPIVVERPAAPKRRKQDTLPVRQFKDETTQPRARMPQRPDSAAPALDEVPEALRQRGAAAETLNLENYDPERLKRILEQAQAEAASRAPEQGGGIALPIIIATIVAVTVIAMAVIVVLFI